jgi:1-acyl-sn-glycerol-3-phosphate acyltransferase
MYRKFCRFIFEKVLGWRVEGPIPTDVDKYIFSAVPHTSNWDFVLGYTAIQAYDLDVRVFAKDAFFFFPLNYLCKWLNVWPVNRRESTNMVDYLVSQYQQNDKLACLITPEGTRSYRERLKSGYYHVAKNADVPIVVAVPNYDEKVVYLQPPRKVLDSFEEDQKFIVELSLRIGKGKHPERAIK